MASTSTERFHRWDFHPLESQLASLHRLFHPLRSCRFIPAHYHRHSTLLPVSNKVFLWVEGLFATIAFRIARTGIRTRLARGFWLYFLF